MHNVLLCPVARAVYNEIVIIYTTLETLNRANSIVISIPDCVSGIDCELK